VWQFAPSTNPTPEFDPTDLLPVTFDRGVSSLGGNSVCPCWVETNTYASWVERLVNSPVIRHQTMKRGQKSLKTAPTFSSAHRSFPPWLKLATATLNKNLCVFQMLLPASSEKTFLMCRSPGRRWPQSQTVILPPTGFSETISRCRCSSLEARRPSTRSGFAESVAPCMGEYSLL